MGIPSHNRRKTCASRIHPGPIFCRILTLLAKNIRAQPKKATSQRKLGNLLSNGLNPQHPPFYLENLQPHSYSSSVRKSGSILFYVQDFFLRNLKQCKPSNLESRWACLLSHLPFSIISQSGASDLEIHKDEAFCNNGSTTEFLQGGGEDFCFCFCSTFFLLTQKQHPGIQRSKLIHTLESLCNTRNKWIVNLTDAIFSTFTQNPNQYLVLQIILLLQG